MYLFYEIPVHIFSANWNSSRIIVSKAFHDFAGYLNNWIEQSQNQGHQVFLGAGSKFLDAIADPDLSPLSQDKWNLWMQCSASDKEKVSQTTGMRSDLNLPFDRAHPWCQSHCNVHWPWFYKSGRKPGDESCQDMPWSWIKVSSLLA